MFLVYCPDMVSAYRYGGNAKWNWLVLFSIRGKYTRLVNSMNPHPSARKVGKKGNEHPTFYKIVTQSPQWKCWEEEQRIRLHEFNKRKNPYHFEKLKGVYDMAEVIECGWISQQHFQDFIKFVTKGY